MPESGSSIALAQIGQIALSVTDLDRAVAFYKDSLGMKFLFRPPNLAFFDCAGVRLMLDPVENTKDKFSSVLYFKVANLEEAYTGLQAKGVEFVHKPHLIARMPDHELWMAFFRDPDQNLLALMSEVRP